MAGDRVARLLTRNQAITALTLAEWLVSGMDPDSPHVAAWRADLADGESL